MTKQRPDAAYLFVEIELQNKSRQPTAIPLLQLIDERGNEFARSSRDFFIPGHINPFEPLNPNVPKRGKVVFDVRRGMGYRLRMTGGGPAGGSALISLKPKR